MNTKNRILSLLSLCLILAMLTTGCGRTAPDHVSFIINGTKLETPPQTSLTNNTLMVPASFIKETFGIEIEQEQEEQPAAAELALAVDMPVYYSDQVAVLMYHHLSTTEDKQDVLRADRFEEHMEQLKVHGFHVISMDEYAAFMLEGGSIPNNAVLLTFDDGYESFYSLAAPVLQAYGYAASNFIIVSSIDNPDHGTPKMTWDQMRELQLAGMSFYSHTLNAHRYGEIDAEGTMKPMLTRHLYLENHNRVETDEEYIARITQDLKEAEERLSAEFGNTRSAVAFPYGAFNDAVMEVLASLDIRLSFTVKEGLNTRQDRKAYRMNAGHASITADMLINKLMTIQTGEDLNSGGEPDVKTYDGIPIEIIVAGQGIALSGIKPHGDNTELMVPLRDFCRLYDIKLSWDNRNKTVTLNYDQNELSATAAIHLVRLSPDELSPTGSASRK
ncbi:polysaccharide deacetylase [Paenibacillaceae bacterium]|nr:polysaccharide deacetylase [Paenibacillaceae bacterium]